MFFWFSEANKESCHRKNVRVWLILVYSVFIKKSYVRLPGQWLTVSVTMFASLHLDKSKETSTDNSMTVQKTRPSSRVQRCNKSGIDNMKLILKTLYEFFSRSESRKTPINIDSGGRISVHSDLWRSFIEA